MRASGASELRKFSHFHILKLLFPQYFVGTSDTLSQKHIHFLVSNNICIHIHYQFIFLYHLWYDVEYKRQYTDKTHTLRKCRYMRASGASEFRKFWYFLILKLLFPSIFLLVLQILCLRNIFNFRCQITSAYIYNQCSFI